MANNKHLMLSMRPRRRRRRRFFFSGLHCARVPFQAECLSRFVSIFICYFLFFVLYAHTIRTRSSRTDDTEDASALITIMMLLSMT